MPSLKTLLASAAMAYLATAKTIKITATSDNKFDPETVEAEKDDVIEFHFEPKNHSVVAGDYRYPCSPLDLGSGFFSGFLPTDSGSADQVFQVTVNDTDPTPFYSSQGKECAEGMVGIINPDKNQTLSDYKERAAKLSSGVNPGKKSFGGELVDSSDAKSDDKDSGKSSDSKDGDGDDSAAGTIGAPFAGLVAAIGLAFVMA